ncbi:hypothetical protein JST97_08785 [bacterium]|nr:hypothetical protein [bacterium]
MKAIFLMLLLGLPASAEDWKEKLSPRMREAFKDMSRDDWKPQKAATLSDKEKNELRNLWDSLHRVPVASPPALPPQTPKAEGK